MHKLILFTLCLVPAIAYANVVWPALYLEIRLLSWWAIGIGVIIELCFIKWLFAFSTRKTVISVLAANIVSAIAGIILLPLLGVVWELFPGSMINWAFSWGTFNPITWGATFVLGCLVNAVLEGTVYKKWFAPEFKFKSRAFFWLLVANSISVSVAFISLWLKPVQL